MSSRIAILTASLLLAAAAACRSRSYNTAKVKIIGGFIPDASAPTRSVTLGFRTSDDKKVFCTGVYLGEGRVITASHCVDGLTADAFEVFREKPTSSSKAESVFKVESVTRFLEDERVYAPNFDVALVKIQGADLHDLKPAKIASPGLAKAGAKVTLVGFGLTETDCDVAKKGCAGQMRAVETVIGARIDTSRFFSLLSLGPNPGKGACNGDSGGPALIVTGQDVFVAGIAQGFYAPLTPVSFPSGNLKCEEGQILYTSLWDYGPWLRETSQLNVGGAKSSRLQNIKKQVATNSKDDWCLNEDFRSEEWFTFGEVVRSAVAELPYESQGKIMLDCGLIKNEVTKLKALNLTGFSFDGKRYVRSLEPLATLEALETLTIQGNEVSNLSPLSKLKNLRSLKVTHNYRQNPARVIEFPLSPLKAIKTLKTLDLSFNAPMGLQAGPRFRFEELHGLGLEELSAVDSLISDLDGIQRLSTLKRVAIADTVRPSPIRDFGPIGSLENLETLHLGGAPLGPLSKLERLKKLTSLTLDKMELNEISSIAKFTFLQNLSLPGNAIKDVSPLDGRTLQSVILSGNPLPQDICTGFQSRGTNCEFE